MDSVVTFAPLIVLFFIWMSLSQKADEAKRRQQTILKKLQRIEEHLGLNEVSLEEAALQVELVQLLHEGKTVEAVKRVRETLGSSLLEAKQYVDQLKSEHGI
ncbi:hypothetical protein ASF99_01090 [Exiguobacterium sp. Leaf187]|uniref:Ribosomal protein L7/L12 C-terminal domain-containing protein n=1 Tax=Exiguobacterium indicum TaxID=296995 RepID=A0ABU8EIM0_9BACL|nr:MULTISPECIES: hypothetical protein [Exiguobacterium]KQS18521.1 hypothetical protein ASF99_01090 [Exiguobacterium sp. Leaf187]MDT0171864.1 hypothetical protein [Exiguobacterium sp. BRG2]NTY09142.1 hypothetical protein [Exiguobacterium sp. JMULE1]HBQ75444.1 hypothetical protein [Exiguobacterium sp.]HCD57697.1 hypothetical protein [Exiguobacterium sp.]